MLFEEIPEGYGLDTGIPRSSHVLGEMSLAVCAVILVKPGNEEEKQRRYRLASVAIAHHGSHGEQNLHGDIGKDVIWVLISDLVHMVVEIFQGTQLLESYSFAINLLKDSCDLKNALAVTEDWELLVTPENKIHQI